MNKDLRKRIVEGSKKYKLGHCGSALSCVDTINYLYKEVIKEEDIFILSKGHGSMALYVVLEDKGISPKWEMQLNLNEKKGIYATTGSLGHGLPIAVGRAFGKKLKKEKGNIYVLMGDCEMAEGSNWESMLIAKTLEIDNLTMLIDSNKYGSAFPVIKELKDYSLKKKINAFGFNTIIIDGHKEKELAKIKNVKGLNAILLNTIKGKGIDFLEKSHSHRCNFSLEPERYKEVMNYFRDGKEDSLQGKNE